MLLDYHYSSQLHHGSLSCYSSNYDHLVLVRKEMGGKSMKPWHNRFLLLIIPLTLFSLCTAIDTITPTHPLSDNETLVSSNGLFALGFFTPTNSNNRYLGLWYNQITVQTILWVANRDDPVSNSKGTLLITINGTLIITNQNSTVIWSVNTSGLTNPIAKLLDTGNFVVDGSDGRIYAWQGFDYPTDTLIPGMKLGVDYTRGHSWNLTAWRSDNDPSSGEQYLVMDTSSGDPEISLKITKFKEWRSGPWDGIQFNGIPDMVQNFKANEIFSFVNTSKEVAYSYQVTDQSIMPRLVVNRSGIIQQWVWGRNQWNISWFAPKDKCDGFGQCGPYEICNPVDLQICSCVQGFVPINRGDWIKGHGSLGCTRMTPLDCQPATTDGFLIVIEVKLPDTQYSSVTMSMSLDECKVLCLGTCSCTAFAVVNDSGIGGGIGGGCIIWEYELSDIKQQNGAGQNLYVRLAAADLGTTPPPSLDCQPAMNDDFLIVKVVKLPDNQYSSAIMNTSLDECKVLCLRTCNCTAFAVVNDSGIGGGCIIWKYKLSDIKQQNDAGQNLHVRVAAADRAPIKSHKRRIKMVAMIVSPLFGILLSCLCYFLWKRKKWRQGVNNYFEDGGNVLDLPIVDFDDIAAATDCFSAGNKLGEGGFGPVYKGKLGEDKKIAVKRLSKTSQQGVEEFKNEVQLIAKLQHINLVRLLACCIQGDERMLIYEYMPNKSLDAFLFGKNEITLLSWRTRYRIIIGIARGLVYLHQDSRFRIIHRDLKASNILLDKDMNPKISDFGLARIFGGEETDFNTRKIVGTYGYMSPEYALEGTFSMKSDIFSFGVLVLEIISGKKNRGLYAFSPHLNLLAHAWSLWSEGDVLQLVQEGMGSVPTNVGLKCIKIGLLCVQERPEDRPLMSNVIEMFSSDISSLPQPNPPGFVSRFGPLEIDRQEPCSLNGVSITELSCR